MSAPKQLSLWRCDYCAGPANWTMVRGVPYFCCKSQCDGFMQIEMWVDESPNDSEIDSRVSVRALTDDGRPARLWEKNSLSADADGLSF